MTITQQEHLLPTRNTVALASDGLDLTITSVDGFAALVLAFDTDAGNGAYLNCDVRPGVTVVHLPLRGDHVAVEVLDVADGTVMGSLDESDVTA